MIGVFVTFRYGDNFDERAVRKIAETARVRFEGMPAVCGLRARPDRGPFHRPDPRYRACAGPDDADRWFRREDNESESAIAAGRET